MARLGQQSNRYKSWYLQRVQKKQPYYNTSALRVASRSYLGYSNQVLRGERGPDGIPGPQGTTGQSFEIKYTYNSLALLLAAVPAEFPCFALVAGTLAEADDDYGKLYYYNDATSGWQFTADMSIQGIEGKHMLSGNGAPASGLGKDGDMYIDITAKELYGPKNSSQGVPWGAAISLQGNAGASGTGGGTWTGNIDMDGYDVINIGTATTDKLSITDNTIENTTTGSSGDINLKPAENYCAGQSGYYNEPDCTNAGGSWVPSKSVIILDAVRITNDVDGGIIKAGTGQDLKFFTSSGGTTGDFTVTTAGYNKFYTDETHNFYNLDGTNEILKLDPAGGHGLSLSNATGTDCHLKTFTSTDLSIDAVVGMLNLSGSNGVNIQGIFALDNTSAVRHSPGVATLIISESTADHTPGTYTTHPIAGYPSQLSGGQGGQATVVVAANGSISSITVTEGGYNYDLGDTVALNTAASGIGGTTARARVTSLEASHFSSDERTNAHDYLVPTINAVNQHITQERRDSRYDHLLIIPSDWMPADSSSTYNIGIYDWGTSASVGAVRPMSAYLEMWAFKEIPKGFKATSIDIWISQKLTTDVTEIVVWEKYWDNTPPVNRGSLNMTGNLSYHMYQLDFTDITSSGDNMIALQIDPAGTTTQIIGAKIYIEEV